MIVCFCCCGRRNRIVELDYHSFSELCEFIFFRYLYRDRQNGYQPAGHAKREQDYHQELIGQGTSTREARKGLSAFAWKRKKARAVSARLAPLEDLICIVTKLPCYVLVERSVSQIRRADDCEVQTQDGDRSSNRHTGDLTSLRPEGTDDGKNRR